MTVFISRRELLKRTALAGAAAAVAPVFAASSTAPAPDASAPPLQSAAREALEQLTPVEAEILDAIGARLVPTDANGPGAIEARATRYIDRALGGALASSRPAYASGLAALDRYARTSRGRPFTALPPPDQDVVLTDIERGAAAGFDESSATFFAMVRAHVLQGTFCDPFYGGNANFVGWDLVGYPGVRTVVTPEDQRLGVDVEPNHKSAYEYDMFTKASASAADHPPPHGH